MDRYRRPDLPMKNQSKTYPFQRNCSKTRRSWLDLICEVFFHNSAATLRSQATVEIWRQQFILWRQKCGNMWRHDLWLASICDCGTICDHIMLQLWPGHALWPKNASICDQRYTMILESKLCRGKLVFVFTLIMYTKWYNMIIYIYELWYDAYINSGARTLMLFT